MVSIGREGKGDRCLMMEREKVANVEAVNGETVRNQFACHYRNMILIERAVRHAICFVAGKVASED